MRLRERLREEGKLLRLSLFDGLSYISGKWDHVDPEVGEISRQARLLVKLFAAALAWFVIGFVLFFAVSSSSP